MLTAGCIEKFTTDSSSTVYKLCDENIDDSLCTVIYYTAGGSVYNFSYEADFVLAVQGDTEAVLDRGAGTITFTKPLIDAKSAGIKNNLVVTYSKTIEQRIPAQYCGLGTWFEDGDQSANGSSCLFLSGDEEMPNRIYYSASPDPTFFTWDSYIDIGVPADPVTAFGIQYDILAVFKERSLYSISYSSGEKSAGFSVKNVNASVGCDMPATVKLIPNALVWGNSAGGIYALQSTTIKDERAVKLVSQKINPKLLSLPAEDLQAASAACDGISYFLLAGDNVFILNYELLQFKNCCTPKGIAWYIWKLPKVLFGF